MSASLTIHLPDPVFSYVQEQANRLGTSIEAWLVRELELQKRMQDHAEAIFDTAPKPADPNTWKDMLKRLPAAPPMAGDELEAA